MFCDTCGSEVGTGWAYCRSCGNAVVISPAVGAPPSGVGEVPAEPPPPVLPPRPAAVSSPTAASYRSLRGLATALTWLLALGAFSALAMTGASEYRSNMFRRASNGKRFSIGYAEGADNAVSSTSFLAFLFFIAIGVVLIVFLFRASKNSGLWKSSRPRWSAGWTIGSWFIPIANLVIPALVVRDIWKRTPRLDDEGGEREPHADLVWVWWGALIAGLLLRRLGVVLNAANLATERTVLADASRADATAAGGSLMLVAASVLLIVLVRRLAERQQLLRDRVLGD